MTSVNSQMARGAFWMVFFKIVERGIGAVSTLILVRLLSKDDFGVVAIAMAVIGLLELLGNFSFDVTLIQQSEVSRDDMDSAWSCNLVLCLTEALLVIAIAAPFAQFYEDPRLLPVVICLSVIFFGSALSNIGVVMFRKEMEFDKEFKFLLYRKLAGFVVTVPLAFLLQSYWALVIGIVASQLVRIVTSYTMHDYRPRLCFTKWRELYSFSKWLYINNLILFINTRSAEFILGKTSGSAAVGSYAISNEISSLPTTDLVAPINRAIFPGYALIKHDPTVLTKGYLDIAGLIALLALPFGFGIAASAALMVPVLLGRGWLDTVTLIQFIAISGGLSALLTNATAAFIAIGRPVLITQVFGLRILLLLPLMVWASIDYGALGAAAALLVTTCVMTPINLFVTFRVLNIRYADYTHYVGRPFVAAVAMYIVTSRLTEHLANATALATPLALLLSVGVGALVYTGTVLTLWKIAGLPSGPERFAWDWLRARPLARRLLSR